MEAQESTVDVRQEMEFLITRLPETTFDTEKQKEDLIKYVIESYKSYGAWDSSIDEEKFIAHLMSLAPRTA